jgi:hypothetical protein
MLHLISGSAALQRCGNRTFLSPASDSLLNNKQKEQVKSFLRKWWEGSGGMGFLHRRGQGEGGTELGTIEEGGGSAALSRRWRRRPMSGENVKLPLQNR